MIGYSNLHDHLFSDIEKHLAPNNFRLVGMEINNNNIFQGAVQFWSVYS